MAFAYQASEAAAKAAGPWRFFCSIRSDARSPVRSFLFLVAMPFAPSSFLLLVVGLGPLGQKVFGQLNWSCPYFLLEGIGIPSFEPAPLAFVRHQDGAQIFGKDAE